MPNSVMKAEQLSNNPYKLWQTSEFARRSVCVALIIKACYGSCCGSVVQLFQKLVIKNDGNLERFGPFLRNMPL